MTKTQYRQISILRAAFMLLVFVWLSGTALGEQQPAASPSKAPSATPAEAATPIPMAEVITQAQSATTSLRNIEAESSSDEVVKKIAEGLPGLTSEIDSHRDESTGILASNPSIETLRNLDGTWHELGTTLADWQESLSTRAERVDSEIEQLNQMEKKWTETLNLAHESDAPPDLVQRIEATIDAVKQTRRVMEEQRKQILSLQNRVAGEDARVQEMRGLIQQAHGAALDRLLVRDRPPIWSSQARAYPAQELLQQGRESFRTQLRALGAYVQRQAGSFGIHAAICAALIALFFRARRMVRRWVEEDPSLKSATRIFEVPVSAAILFSLLASGWVYPEAPRLLWALLGAVALIPTVIVLRRLIERHLFPIINALLVLYLAAQIGVVAAPLPWVSRLLFLAQMLGGIGFVIWLAIFSRFSEVPAVRNSSLWRIIRGAARFALLVFVAAFVANMLGYVAFSTFLGRAAFASAYLGILLYAATRILEGLVIFFLQIPPLALLRIVQKHRPLLIQRASRFIGVIAWIAWLFLTLEELSLRQPLIDRTMAVLNAEAVLGSLHLSLGNVIAFVLTVWATFVFSRFLRFLLEEDVYQRFQLARGLPYAISTMLHYAILLTGFFIAIAALGVDMTKFTILAGAFGVGVGFGLQNIINNFVSSIIVLFERPIQIGDAVQIGDATGVVEHIGIRASVIRTTSGSEIIMPNGKFISDPVINWTFSNRQRLIEVPVNVALATDANRVIELLQSAASAHPHVVNDPPPQALLTKLGPGSLGFELRAWTARFDEWMQVRSELITAVNTALAGAKIAVV